MTLNINGSAYEKIKDTQFRSIANNYDIICLTETGYESIDNIPGFHTSHMPRDDKSRNAGVAVLISNRITKSCRIIRKHPHLGIMWVDINIKDHDRISLACCYLPHQASSRHMKSDFKVKDHYKCLNSDIEELSACSKIIVCGDMNSRVGQLEDNLNSQWAHAHQTENMIENIYRNVPKRVSCDTKASNLMGKLLINLCKNNKL